MSRFRYTWAATLALLFFARAAFADSGGLGSHDDDDAYIHVEAGLAGGGAPALLLSPDPGEHTTSLLTGLVLIRAQLPRVSPRVLELYSVVGSGFGASLRNDDFSLGSVKFHLLDVGLFYNHYEPVSVRRVERTLDLTLGFGVEWRVRSRWVLTSDWRMFTPLNVYRVLVDHGDFARLIFQESLYGGQAWLGLLYYW